MNRKPVFVRVCGWIVVVWVVMFIVFDVILVDVHNTWLALHPISAWTWIPGYLAFFVWAAASLVRWAVAHQAKMQAANLQAYMLAGGAARGFAPGPQPPPAAPGPQPADVVPGPQPPPAPLAAWHGAGVCHVCGGLPAIVRCLGHQVSVCAGCAPGHDTVDCLYIPAARAYRGGAPAEAPPARPRTIAQSPLGLTAVR